MNKKTYDSYTFIILSILGVILLLVIGSITKNRESILNFYIYQIITLLLSIFIIGICYLIKGNFDYFKIGDLNANVRTNRLLGISKTDKWLKVGLNFSIIITIITAYFVIINYNNAENINLLDILLAFGISIPLAIINSFNEEIITRWLIVEGFSQNKNKTIAPIFSGIIFGIPHYFGVPGGIIGSIMAGFLGYFLAVSIQDTKGIGWAFIIHLLQDLVIITVLILNILKN